MFRIIHRNSAAGRLEAARQFIRSYPPSTEMLLIGASRESIDDLVREISVSAQATFGFHRFTLLQLASSVAAPSLARIGLAPAAGLGIRAVAARAAFETLGKESPSRFATVGGSPGFARALARTLTELRLAEINPLTLAESVPQSSDLGVLLGAYEHALSAAGIADQAAVCNAAAAAVRSGQFALAGAPLLLLDVPVRGQAARAFLEALSSAVGDILATIPAGDDLTLTAIRTISLGKDRNPDELQTAKSESRTLIDELSSVDLIAEELPERPSPAQSNALERLRDFLFSEEPPPEEDLDESMSFFSAPGEGRECVEIARRILHEARSDVPFDRMAVAVRAPELYTTHLETALQRAQIPAWFSSGTRRPDPAGRAFLALLACAAEGLSAKRFAEYLSLGQVPALEESGAPPAERPFWVPSEDEAQEALDSSEWLESLDEADKTSPPATPIEEAPVIAGTLKAPWQWERLLVESAVIGRKDRWARRLDGLQAEFKLKLAQALAEEPDSARSLALLKQLTDLEHLRRFALPIISFLAAMPSGPQGSPDVASNTDASPADPSTASWDRWLSSLETLVPMVLADPERVLIVLAELRPMAGVGGVSLPEVIEVLRERLSTLDPERPPSRFGRVFVGSPDQMRGRDFDVVFVPGLAEKIFPRKPREDPLLLDETRAQISPRLITRNERVGDERMFLRLAAGAARRRIYLSYPRVEVGEGRPRVPSFYALDIMRAATGRLPDFEQLERQAARESGARLAWPAPLDPARAIDDLEHDLSIISRLLRGEPGAGFGRGRYLMELTPALGRSLRTAYRRWHRPWSPADGLVDPSPGARKALMAHRLTARPYSASMLQRYAVCPYQFFLAAIHRLEPREDVEFLERMDPLTRGEMFHQMQAETFREIERRGMLPLEESRLAEYLEIQDTVALGVAEHYREVLAPAIERVWDDAISDMRADLRLWLQTLVTGQPGWQPIHFEYGFGLQPGPHLDPASRPDPVVLPLGFRFRGAIDMVEQNQAENVLRITDHKTGLNPTREGLVVGGGEILQPVLYGLAVEAALEGIATEGRLWYCTSRGGYSQRVVPLDEPARAGATEVLTRINQAVESAFLPAAPRKRACTYCDFREVCGSREETRVMVKDQDSLAALVQLRGMP